MLATLLLAAVLSVPSEGFVLIQGDSTTVEDGSFDIHEMNAVREAYGPNVFWFRSGGRSYIIRDAAVLKQIDALFQPQRDLGEKQAKYGEKQAELGRQQAALGARQARAGGDAQLQEQLSRQQEDLGRQQEALGDIQSDLGKKQEEAGREVREQLSKLSKDWIRNGVAKPLVH